MHIIFLRHGVYNTYCVNTFQTGWTIEHGFRDKIREGYQCGGEYYANPCRL